LNLRGIGPKSSSFSINNKMGLRSNVILGSILKRLNASPPSKYFELGTGLDG